MERSAVIVPLLERPTIVDGRRSTGAPGGQKGGTRGDG